MGKASRRKRQRKQEESSEAVKKTKSETEPAAAGKKDSQVTPKNEHQVKVDVTQAGSIAKKADNGNKEKVKAKNSNDEKLKKQSPSSPSNTAETLESNPLESEVEKFLKDISAEERDHFFSDEHVDPERRAELWMRQADVGEESVNKYAWAIPDERALRVLKHFSPLIEIGCGANAYWCKQMKCVGIDVVGYDSNPESGGKITKNNSKRQKFQVKKGGPEVLSQSENKDRNLFLCYPDENDNPGEGDEQFSLGLACLEKFNGDYVVHVGEIYGDTLSMDQAPWGRSSSPGFQELLASQFHCVLQIPLPNWIHVRDTLTVWKRSSLCSLVFGDEEEEGSVDEVTYRYIPPEERLPTERVAPFIEKILQTHTDSNASRDSSSEKSPDGDDMETHAKQENRVSRKPRKQKQAFVDKAKEKSGYECPW